MPTLSKARRQHIERARILHRIHSASQALERPGSPAAWVLDELHFLVEEVEGHRRHFSRGDLLPDGLSHDSVLEDLDAIAGSLRTAADVLAVTGDRWAINTRLTRAFLDTAALGGRLARVARPVSPAPMPGPGPG